MSTLAPLFKTGKWGGVPAEQVPTNIITFMLGKDDLFPVVRSRLEAELERRRASSSTDDETEPARPLVAQRSRSATVEPLPPELQDDEPFEARFVCPSCGSHAKMTGRLAIVK